MLKVCGSHRIWILLFAVIASHGNCIRFCVGLFSHLAILNFVFWEFTKELQWSYVLTRSFQTPPKTLIGFVSCVFASKFLLLCIVISAWNYHSLELLAENKQSNERGLEHYRASI